MLNKSSKTNYLVRRAVIKKERTGNNTFTYSFGDDSIHYQLYYTYVNEEPYRAKYNVKVKNLNPPVKFEETNNEVVDNLDNEQIQENTEEIPPSFNGDLNEWVNKNLNYPKEAIENGIMGKVIVRFMVDKDGNVTQVQIVRSPDPILSREALRLFKTMPKWTPGTQGGKPGWSLVNLSYNISVFLAHVFCTAP